MKFSTYNRHIYLIDLIPVLWNFNHRIFTLENFFVGHNITSSRMIITSFWKENETTTKNQTGKRFFNIYVHWEFLNTL